MSYWTKRQEQLNKELEKDEAKLKNRLSSFYDTEYEKLQKEISSYFQKYGADNVLEYRILMQSLPELDRKVLLERMDEFAEKYPQYDYLMPVRESIYKLNRLEGLQYSVRMQQYEMGAITREELNKHLERQAMRGVNAAAEAMGVGENFYANNPDVVKLFVDVPWSNGKNFSQRIWDNTEKLSNYLNTDIAQGFARGDSYAKLTRQLKKRFGDVSRNDAYRLIYTEGTYVMAESTMQPFTEDFEEYKISTVDDGKVCAICRGLAEKTFKIADRKPGVNFPPLHTWCRCSFEIVVGEWDKWMDDYEKRHSNGQAQKVAERLKPENRDDIISSGAVSGARNPESEKAKEHAERYYGLVRSMTTDVSKIAKVTGYSESEILGIKKYIFLDKHDLGGSGPEYFEPDYMMAESWKRLMNGHPEEHDLVLIKHEIMEKELISQGMSQKEAHIRTSKKYNYDREANKFYGKIKKYKEK